MSSRYAALTRSFEARDIDAGVFRHADHVGVAYEMLRKYDFMDATSRYAANIKSIATEAGAPEKFSVTITIAFLSLIAERMGSSEHADYEDFISRNLDLLSKDVLGKRYSPQRLGSDLSRAVFLMPDEPG